MSHFTEMNVECNQKNEQCLVEALEEIFGKGSVEVHEEPTGLYGYGGDLRSNLSKNNANYAPPCHLVIRRKHVGGASNDVGFRRNENGTYDAYISDYDKGGNFNQAKVDKMMQHYTSGVTVKQLKKQGYNVTKKVEQGNIVLIGSKFKA